MDEKTKQMKMKMNKYKQGAGSDSRLEQDYHKVKLCPHISSLWSEDVAAACVDHMVYLEERSCRLTSNIMCVMYFSDCTADMYTLRDMTMTMT